MIRSSVSRRRYCATLPAVKTMLAWVIITPFGFPVLPEV
jgi:hypothetical protein